ncbi:MAG: ORF6N domain-containing protein [Gammaproteobacteria bacterium]
MPTNTAVEVAKQIEKRVILDADLSALYGVTTKRLNEQVKRNKERFPADFMFQLTSAEKQEVVAICDHLSSLKFSRTTPLLLLNTAPSWLLACSTRHTQLKLAS